MERKTDNLRFLFTASSRCYFKLLKNYEETVAKQIFICCFLNAWPKSELWGYRFIRFWPFCSCLASQNSGVHANSHHQKDVMGPPEVGLPGEVLFRQNIKMPFKFCSTWLPLSWSLLLFPRNTLWETSFLTDMKDIPQVALNVRMAASP